ARRAAGGAGRTPAGAAAEPRARAAARPPPRSVVAVGARRAGRSAPAEPRLPRVTRGVHGRAGVRLRRGPLRPARDRRFRLWTLPAAGGGTGPGTRTEAGVRTRFSGRE